MDQPLSCQSNSLPLHPVVPGRLGEEEVLVIDELISYPYKYQLNDIYVYILNI
jgi:hypothetical protein